MYLCTLRVDAWQYKKTEKDTFFNTIYLKENIVEQLERQLTSPNWKGEVINLGGITDNYQPWEKENGIMTEILKVLIKYKNPCIISTKSDLILRDFDLIDQLSKMTYVNIAATITCIDKELAAKIEPAAALPAHRFNMLKAFQKTGAVTGVHDMPIIPFLTDTDEILESLFEGAICCGANYILTQPLNLKGRTKEVFFEFIWNQFPSLLEDLNVLYREAEEKRRYKRKLYQRIKTLERKYNISGRYMESAKGKFKLKEPARDKETQLTFL